MKQRSRRNGTAQLVRKVVLLVQTLHGGPMTRARMAETWGCTPRNVNHTITRARALFGVKVRHVHPLGYQLVDAGILNLDTITRRSLR